MAAMDAPVASQLILEATQPLDHDKQGADTLVPQSVLHAKRSWGRLLVLCPVLQAIELIQPSYLIGRAPHADVPLGDAISCSREHCRIYLIAAEGTQGGAYPCLQDMSTNGTIVNGQQLAVKKIFLPPQAEIHIKPDKHFVFISALHLENPPRTLDGLQLVGGHYYVFATETLGNGAFATVKLAIDLRNGDHLACKVIDKHGQTTKARHAITQRHIESEMAILKSIRHPNIVPVKDIVVTDTHVCIFMTKISGGELFDYIHKTNGLEETIAKFMFYQTLLAVQYLHRRNITHRDLKPENILLISEEETSRLVITDFGLAKMLDPTLARMKTKCGTLSYLAPEVLDSGVKGGYSKHVDCWSLGVLLFKMLAGYLPFGDEGDTVSLMERVRSGKFNFGQPQWKGISVQGKDMIRRFLEVDPLKRLTVDEALRHPWIANQKSTLRKLYRRCCRKGPTWFPNGRGV